MASFHDRSDAGRRLGKRLAGLRGRDVVVLGLPRGGVPVAFEVAKALEAPLDVIVVRKLGVPFQPEVAMGAIGEGNVRVLDPRTISMARVSQEDLQRVERQERALLESRVARFRQGRRRIDLTGRTAVIVDDGIATGSTARVACQVARQLGAARVILAVPVAPARAIVELKEPDDIVCLMSPQDFQAVGYYYHDFSPTEDGEVVQLLDAAAGPADHRDGHGGDGSLEDDVEIPDGQAILRGSLYLPARCDGTVLFAHGSGSSRHSPRNRFVASVLHGAGLGTLLLDLLTPEEEVNRANVFDIALLAHRLSAATHWLEARHDGSAGRIGYLGASTGAGAALWAAAEPGAQVAAVVSRGGRPDLAGPRLAAVKAPTLLIVGGADTQVLALNRQAMARMQAPTRLEVVPGATHLFEEPGTLAMAATLAADWFRHYLLPSPVGRHAPGASE
ncbi:phosphoribosyltransferase family protein [Pseudarthrobacter sp. C4D7]|uniref:phosphoribosyltransferase family protein n=1 Tax=Pseudarthrobacter sp. C4D7 TaxID=2735268 RepID=UPI001585089E|nr:phosphoribosyltransferase family protein [Pseudarthrobacter sp. C4D7]NUT71313.1 phosphoribosyltransferase [Pseudarthrobacter sp. C4D7]